MGERVKINKDRVWQIAAGEPGRNYSNLFIQYDVMFQGPGQYGEYEKEKYQAVATQGERSSVKIGMIRHFYEDVEIGDIVLMRFRNRAEAIGIVASEAHFDKRFDDIYGWDVEHKRRVIWQNELKDDLEKIQNETGEFFSSRAGTFSRVRSPETLKAILPLIQNIETRELNKLPEFPEESLSLERVGEYLFSEGLPNDSIQ